MAPGHTATSSTRCTEMGLRISHGAHLVIEQRGRQRERLANRSRPQRRADPYLGGSISRKRESQISEQLTV